MRLPALLASALLILGLGIDVSCAAPISNVGNQLVRLTSAASESGVIRVRSDEDDDDEDGDDDDSGEDGRGGYHDGYDADAPYARVESGRSVIVDAPFAHVYVGRHGRRVVAPFVDIWISK